MSSYQTSFFHFWQSANFSQTFAVNELLNLSNILSPKSYMHAFTSGKFRIRYMTHRKPIHLRRENIIMILRSFDGKRSGSQCSPPGKSTTILTAQIQSSLYPNKNAVLSHHSPHNAGFNGHPGTLPACHYENGTAVFSCSDACIPGNDHRFGGCGP